MQDVLADVQGDERLTGVLSVRVDGESDAGGGTQRAAERDYAKEDGRNDPVVFLFHAPAKAHESRDSGDGDRDRHDETKFWLVDAAVLARHVADDEVGDFSCDRGADDAANERADVDEADLEGREVVAVAVFVDVADGLGEDDEPADRHGVDERAPHDARISEQEEGSDSDTPPAVVADPSVPHFQLLSERSGWGFS